METSKLIETLRFCGDQESCCTKCPSGNRVTEYSATECLCDLMQRAADKLSELKEQNRWIPVTERLPEDDLPKGSKKKVIKALVAIKADNGVYTIRSQTRQKGYYYNYPEKWDWGKFSHGTITHWMPLPEPPKGE